MQMYDVYKLVGCKLAKAGHILACPVSIPGERFRCSLMWEINCIQTIILTYWSNIDTFPEAYSGKTEDDELFY